MPAADPDALDPAPMRPPASERTDRGGARRRSLLAGVLVGAATMAFADVIVFHQLLRWHHFYDRGTDDAGLVSDGLLDVAVLAATVAGTWLAAALARDRALSRSRLGAGFVLGLGGFQLWDGVVDHKVLRTHQIRYGVETWPYDVAWIAAALVVLALGVVLLRRARRAEAALDAAAAAGADAPVAGVQALVRPVGAQDP